MKKSLFEQQRYSDLEHELDIAIENYEFYVSVQDYNLADMWMDTINHIIEQVKGWEQ